ncbi:hypothetical protein EJ08DRAFT_123005 [Tothia fuscella]|uniref:Zn(2)-C6 fungal-type domain-containing protein n=1 Tax=Tothia fuscella TaxID=1048955 RepID=A0A9P4NUN9_9PEZI|nr:hypothetical protein EJ08DRAFT_123005 [Tothia fuscella]
MDADPGTHASEGTQILSSRPLSNGTSGTNPIKTTKPRVRNRKKDSNADDEANKRRCVSTACIACRRRKSKCDGNLPACAACSSVYNTECVYDPNSDHRRKGVYKKDIDKLKTRNSTLEVLIQAVLNFPEDEVPSLVQQIRTCDSLDAVAEAILAKEAGMEDDEDDDLRDSIDEEHMGKAPTFETQLSGKMGQLQLEAGSTRYLGGTSNLIYLGTENDNDDQDLITMDYQQQDNPTTSWTNVTKDPELVTHLIHMYFTWHYTYFTTLSKSLFMREFSLGAPPPGTRRKTEYCTPLLVNAMLALGCHFTSWPAARDDRDDSATAGDHFFREAKRLIMVNDEHEKPRLTTVQALALMSVREAGCGREAKGWVYSGMSFRMACDLGLNLDSGTLPGSRESHLDDEEIDARRITFWGCFLFDKCWSNYLGRLPQLPMSIITVPKFDVFPGEESDIWAAYTDSGVNQSHAQPSRTRAVALQISALCEISGDLMNYFYNPIDLDKSKGKSSELKKLSDIHQRLESWRRNLPQELEPKEGGLPSMLVMHMFFQLLYIHLFRPFLKYSQATSPLPANVSPRRLCTQAAAMISKLMRLYRRSHGLRQICNIAVYILHTSCTIHLLSLPDKNSRRDITHGLKHLEEIAESWLCARRTIAILHVLSKKWKVDLPEEAASVLTRAQSKYGTWGEMTAKTPSQRSDSISSAAVSPIQQTFLQSPTTAYFNPQGMSASGSEMPRRPSDTPTLPPQNAADLQRNRLYHQQGTPQSSGVPPSRGSIDSTITAVGSPSTLFGGVDQLLRDSQDWWLKDQNQLALGFEQWPMSESDWLGGVTAAPVNGAGLSYATTDSGDAVAAIGGGFVGANGHANGGSVNGANGISAHDFGRVMNHYPSESEWYL